MALRRASLLFALFSASPGLAQQASFGPQFQPRLSEPDLQFGPSNFALPVIEYQAPDGSWKRSRGIIVGHDISPNATVGIGFFRMAPKYQERTTGPPQSKSRKVSLGFSLRF